MSVELQLGSVGGLGEAEAGRPGGAPAPGEGAGGRAGPGPGVREHIHGWAGPGCSSLFSPVPSHRWAARGGALCFW